jgi:hypothetical protein
LGSGLVAKKITSAQLGLDQGKYLKKGPQSETRLESIVAGAI